MQAEHVPTPAPTLESALTHTVGKRAYVLKMYPRFSETFIVSEILAREAAGRTSSSSPCARRPTPASIPSWHGSKLP